VLARIHARDVAARAVPLLGRKFSEGDHPRDPDGKFGDGVGVPEAKTPAWAAHIPKLKGRHTGFTDAAKANPYRGAAAYKDNCSSTSIAWEMRRRGYDVIAARKQPIPAGAKNHADGVFDGGTASGHLIANVSLTGESGVKYLSRDWADGARGFVYVRWKTGGSHVFAMEKINGNLHYFEPQVPDAADSAERYFPLAVGPVYVYRVDNTDLKENALDFVEVAS
jgi:hypothetical protein